MAQVRGWGWRGGRDYGRVGDIVVGGQLEAKFQGKEWVCESETQLIREGYWYKVLSFG